MAAKPGWVLAFPIGMTLACTGTTPVTPSVTAALVRDQNTAIVSITPRIGSSSGGTVIVIIGRAFAAGASVTVGGAAASAVVVIDAQTITAVTPARDGAGTFDVVVTNADGRTGRLASGFTYADYAIKASATTIGANGSLSVAWTTTAPHRFDWIGLFKKDAANTTYSSGWWQYTDGIASGTLTLTAPAASGEYEFRYLIDDDFIDVARSATVTVVASSH